MIVRQFINWIRTAPAGERAEATRALARAWLISDLSTDDRIAAEGALLMLLDDPSPLVRQAMAEAFARSAEAPAAIVRALSADQPTVALPVLEHSPLLVDADLVDIVATGNDEVQCAVARRIALPVSVCAAIAEVGCAAAALELIENPHAELAPFSWDRIVERHGHLAAIREAMLVLDDLPAATRAALVAKLSETLAQFVVARNWLSADRAERITIEARDRSTMNIAARSRGEDMEGLVRHLRITGQQNLRIRDTHVIHRFGFKPVSPSLLIDSRHAAYSCLELLQPQLQISKNTQTICQRSFEAGCLLALLFIIFCQQFHAPGQFRCPTFITADSGR